MDIFLQKKLLIRVIILLTMLNVVSIGIFLWKDFFSDANKIVAEHHHQDKNKNDKEENFPSNKLQNEQETRELGEILERELSLSKGQVAQIQVLRSKYYNKEKELFKRMKSKKKELTKEIFNRKTNDTLVKSLIKDVSVLEYEKEMIRFEQIQELKTLCTPAQLSKFEDLMEEMKSYFTPKKPAPGK